MESESKSFKSLKLADCCTTIRDVKPLFHLLLALCVQWIAEEMTVPVLVDVTAGALCPGQSTCSEAIYLNGVMETVSAILRMAVLPIVCQLADDYGRKPLLLFIVSSSIFPFVLLAIGKSRGFVYAYYVLRTIYFTMSQRSVLCISVAYAADVVQDDKRTAAFSWITGLASLSHVVGTLLARFLPETYIFKISIALLILCIIYVQLFLVETIKRKPKVQQRTSVASRISEVLKERYRSVRFFTTTVAISPTLKGITLVSFFFEFGNSAVYNVLLYYLKAAFGFDKKQFSEILMVVSVGSFVSQILVLPLINPLVGEKVILCMGILAAIASAVLYGLAWASWVPYLSCSFGTIYILVKPSTYAIISKASSSHDQAKAQGFIGCMQSLANSLSPIAMSPLTSLFLSSDAPFNCKGFSILCASLSMMVAFGCALRLNQEPPSRAENEEDVENVEAPLLS
ncbi:hypothetical protein Ancab_023625 [Ancistrocladus abbreviatus]